MKKSIEDLFYEQIKVMAELLEEQRDLLIQIEEHLNPGALEEDAAEEEDEQEEE